MERVVGVELPCPSELTRLRLRVRGIVQGVGFRPFVFGLASRLDLVGHVCNDGEGVLIEIQGRRVAEFVDLLPREAPPLALLEQVEVSAAPPQPAERFEILQSTRGSSVSALIPPDVAPCPECLEELFDPRDRRYRYPFLNCTNCGPRYSIIRALPYDRPNTTMANFPLCRDCEREYRDPKDRRFHAQPIACPVCGPRLALWDAHGEPVEGDPLAQAVARLRAGQIVAVKGLGGYHLAVDAANQEAVSSLRLRKHREARPLAVMCENLEQARVLCHVSEPEARALSACSRPIVLLERRCGSPVAEAVAPGQRQLGVMLAYTPLHHLLLGDFGRPLVMTSGNVSGEPIVFRDEEARAQLVGLADAILTHNRPIQRSVEDSVVRIDAHGETPLRRSRGYCPRPLPLSSALPVLGCGAEMKSTVCLARGEQAVLSQHLGDLENLNAYEAFQQCVDDLQQLLGSRAAVLAHDMHPDYLSTRWAKVQTGVRLLEVQHHHAHIAACLAENEAEGPVTGVAFDGTGYGTDGTIWGGEFLRATRAGFTRFGCLAPVGMPGGAAAIREPWRMVVAYLGQEVERLPLARRHPAWPLIQKLSGVGVKTSSMGRLFDAVAALLDLCDCNQYEGQSGSMLEQAAERHIRDRYPWSLGEDGLADPRDLLHLVSEDRLRETPAAVISARFHNSVADLVVQAARRSDLPRVALSGGVFQNALLLQRCVEALTTDGFEVLVHSRVPPNDGGISYGQVVVATAVLRTA